MTVSSPRASTLRFYKASMRTVLNHIQARLDETLTLDELAALASLSPYHFHRVFRGMLGEPLAAHVRRLRLERAAHQLKSTDRQVIEVGLDAGYDSHEAFTRAFKAAYGMNPSAFRKSRGTMTLLPNPAGVHYRPTAPLRDFRTLNRRLNMKVEKQDLPPLRVAFVRHTGPYAQCGDAWNLLCSWMGKEGYLGAGCRFIGVSYDDPEVTPPEQIRYDACIVVDDDFVAPAEVGIQVQTLPGGAYACTTHHGPYEKFNDTYSRLMGQEIPRLGWKLRDEPCLEFYLNSPEDTPPAELLTDVFVAIETP